MILWLKGVVQVKPHDVIMLLQQWTHRHFVVELTDTTDLAPNAEPTTTNYVHHISEMDVTTDVCLDSMTVVPHVPPGNTVMVGKGRLQWFDRIIELESPMESPALPPYSLADCDPAISETTRWSLLCLKTDTITGAYILFWTHGKPGMGYPNIPYNGVPLALVRTSPGLISITKEDILNWRCIRPGYAPAAKYWFEPVKDKDSLYDYVDPPEGASALVIDDGTNYYYRNGEWRRAGAPTFDNSSFYTDITEVTTRVDLPWPIKNAVELAVFRDGMYMLYEKDYHVYTGETPYIIFTYNLMPGQRIVIVRNPFFAQAYSVEVELNATQIHDLYVDGEEGNDVWEGTDLHPYKTLQRALNVIPAFSNHLYRIHAKRLKRADMLSSPDGLVSRCYGYLFGVRVGALQFFIEDDYEWYEPQDEYVVYLNGVNYVEFTEATSVCYHILLSGCTGAFTGTHLVANSHVVVEGGIFQFNRVIQDDGNFAVQMQGSCIVDSKDCIYKQLLLQHTGYTYLLRCTIATLTINSDSVSTIYNSTLSDKVLLNNASLFLYNCDATRAEGNFSGGFLQATDMSFPRPYLSNQYTRKRFFYGHHGASFALSNVTITGTDFSSIYMAYGCTLSVTGGAIDQCLYGIEITHGCVASLNGTSLSQNQKSAVYADYHCSVEFINTGGLNNARYACECYNISRASFQNAYTTGALGQYYELMPGADTVLADRENDKVAGTLNQKLAVGQGLQAEVVPSESGLAGDYQLQVDLDLEELIGTGGKFGTPLLNLSAKVNVHEHLEHIYTSGPSKVVTMPISWTGSSYVSSVTRRIFNPVPQTKKVSTILSTKPWFIEEDPWEGTTMESDGVTLVKFPLGVGYKENSPHFFFTNYLEYGALASFGIKELRAFSMEADVPAGTRVQVAFSVNGSGSWRAWHNGLKRWQILPGESTLIQMQSAPDWTTATSLPVEAYDALREMNSQYITVCFLLTTASRLLTPKVKSFTWGYLEDGFLEDITDAFHRQYYSNRAEFTYNGSYGTLEPPVYFSVIPATHRY